MKINYLLLVICILMSVLSISGQEMNLTFRFFGKDALGNSLTVQKVYIKNMTNGTDTMVNGNIYSTSTIGIVNFEPSGRFNVTCYPNPFDGSTIINVHGLDQGELFIEAFRPDGKRITQYHDNIGPGDAKFRYVTREAGINIIRVINNKNVKSFRIICFRSEAVNNIQQLDRTVLKGGIKKSEVETNADPFYIEQGDRLQFVGYSGAYISLSIYDTPFDDKSYTFQFETKYYKLKKHQIITEKPCLINILFSVANKNDKGIDYLSNEDFIVLEDNSTVSPTETFRYVNKSNTVPFVLKTVLLLDNSASVANDLESIKEAASQLINLKLDKQEIAVYSFSDHYNLLQDFTTDKDSLVDAINSITLGFPSTNLYGSIIEAASRWNDYYSTSFIEQGYMVVLTDGDDTQGSYTLTSAINAIGEKKTYMIGLGDEINPENLNKLANPGPYYPITDINDLGGIFTEIQNDIIRQSNSFYWLTYMSPKRTGSHELLLKVKDNTNTLSTSYIEGNFSATGFYSVYSGVYVNKTDWNPYGLDTVYLSNEFPNKYLQATTYWALHPPEYSWEELDSALLIIEDDPIDPKSIWLSRKYELASESHLRVTDYPNDFIKDITVIIKENPAFELDSITDIDGASARGYVNFIFDAGNHITERGICLVEDSMQKSLNNKIILTNQTGIQNTLISGLRNNTTYFAKAYTIYPPDTLYSSFKEFTTTRPVFKIDSVNNITGSSANVFVNFVLDEGIPIVERGICWSDDAIVNITKNKIILPNNPGIQDSIISGLMNGTLYRIKAYEVMSYDTLYSATRYFTTLNPHLKVDSITNITATTARIYTDFISDAEVQVNERGLCWDTNPDAESLVNKIILSNKTGKQDTLISAFQNNTTYYVRAYDILPSDTLFSASKKFYTTNLPTVVIDSIFEVDNSPGDIGLAVRITSEGGSAVTSRGIIWSRYSNLDINNYDEISVSGSGKGIFFDTISGLHPDTIYFFKGYASNIDGTGYSELHSSNESMAVEDYEGNIYRTVKIGNQIWMAENLKTTHYTNGTPLVDGTGKGSISGDYSTKYWFYYNDQPANKDAYGLLYTWAAAMNGASSSVLNPSMVQGICPTGWHLPSDAEWQELEIYLGLSEYEAGLTGYKGTDEGGKLKATGTQYWNTPNTGATNEFSFSLLPAGDRDYSGTFYYLYLGAYLWCSTQSSSTRSYYHYVSYNRSDIYRGYSYKNNAMSVRCVKDQ